MPDFVNGPSGPQVHVVGGLTGSFLLCALLWCSSLRLALLSQLVSGVAGSQGRTVEMRGCVPPFSHPYQIFPDYVLLCSLDDDSDLYSPRYSFSEDSK